MHVIPRLSLLPCVVIVQELVEYALPLGWCHTLLGCGYWSLVRRFFWFGPCQCNWIKWWQLQCSLKFKRLQEHHRCYANCLRETRWLLSTLFCKTFSSTRSMSSPSFSALRFQLSLNRTVGHLLNTSNDPTACSTTALCWYEMSR